MDVVILILLGISLILFFGFFAEFVFRKFNLPDVLFLIIFGFVIGPYGLKYVSSESVAEIAPVFITFTLLFLLFDGAFNIHLSSLVKEFSHSFVLTFFNFIVSSLVVAMVIYVSGFWFGSFSIIISLFAGFLLGGVSSSFVIPILKQIKVPEKLYSILTLESALTDVLCIVFSLSVIEIFRIGSFGFRDTFSQLITLFSVAGLIGILASVFWIVLIIRVFREHNYMMTIAYLILLYVITEFLGGNGAIACLFFGLMLNNSKQLILILQGIKRSKTMKELKEMKRKNKKPIAVSVITPSEEFFYHQISFLLKTFFFVYIGVLIDLSDWKALLVGGIISVVIMFSRTASLLLTRKMENSYKSLINSVFARGLAAAVIAQLAVQEGIPQAGFIAKVAYVVITGTIILSSIRIFLVRNKLLVTEKV